MRWSVDTAAGEGESYRDAIDRAGRVRPTDFHHERCELGRVDGNEDDTETAPYLNRRADERTRLFDRAALTLPKNRLDQHLGDFVLNVCEKMIDQLKVNADPKLNTFARRRPFGVNLEDRSID